mgnify:CR=1 FL=1|tara:strand:+ start:1519 stop:2991 length:1473 start_codon:yes stop_codon:yes gene_type:complete
MQQLSVYNSLSGKKEIFTPISSNYIGMYVCGPTVYSNVHLGNCRTFMSFDLIFRYFKHLGYKVRYVRNITDAGHLENDADEGEDRIGKKARLESIEPMEVVQRYTIDFHNTLAKFNNLPPSIEPTATGHIIEQIEIIKSILKKGFAYEINGSVYFDVLKYNKTHNYGKLSGRKIENLIHNTRTLEGQSDKKNQQDFALWKKAGPKHIMNWPSPWSNGFPGWHLECTAMSTKYLGNHFDIHGGGMDLKFPHHECEIAQAESMTNQAPVNYWFHANMLTLNGQKMAKSTGNNILPNEIFSGENDLFQKAFRPAVVRFFLLQAHYRSIVDLSEDALLASEKGFIRLQDGIQTLKKLTPSSKTEGFDFESWEEKCYGAMNDDFNSPILIAQIFDAIRFVNNVNSGSASITSEDQELLLSKIQVFVEDVMGITLNNSEKNQSINTALEGAISMLINIREIARSNHDYDTSDRIRDELLSIGVQLKDEKDVTGFSI